MEEGIPEEEDESDPEGLSDSGRDNFKLNDVEQGKAKKDFVHKWHFLNKKPKDICAGLKSMSATLNKKPFLFY